MNRQEVFNKVAVALRKQGIASHSGSGRGCLYRCNRRDERTLKCAIGHMIADRDYSASFEGLGVYDMMDWPPKERPPLLAKIRRGSQDVTFLADLQKAHDQFMPRRKRRSLAPWISSMELIASKYNLNPKKLYEAL